MSAAAKAVADILRAPFSAADLEWKVQSAGVKQGGEIWALLAPYIDARACVRRLDEAVGMGGWDIEYRPVELGGKAGFLARLTLRLDDGTVIIREDGAEITAGVADAAIKGGVSGALKRVCATVGIGASLYQMDAAWAIVSDRGQYRGQAKTKGPDGRDQRVTFNYDIPPMAIAQATGGRYQSTRHEVGGGRTPSQDRPAAAPQATAPAPAADGVQWPTKCGGCGGKLWDNRGDQTPNMKCKGSGQKGDKGCGWKFTPAAAAPDQSPIGPAGDDVPRDESDRDNQAVGA